MNRRTQHDCHFTAVVLVVVILTGQAFSQSAKKDAKLGSPTTPVLTVTGALRTSRDFIDPDMRGEINNVLGDSKNIGKPLRFKIDRGRDHGVIENDVLKIETRLGNAIGEATVLNVDAKSATCEYRGIMSIRLGYVVRFTDATKIEIAKAKDVLDAKERQKERLAVAIVEARKLQPTLQSTTERFTIARKSRYVSSDFIDTTQERITKAAKALDSRWPRPDVARSYLGESSAAISRMERIHKMNDGLPTVIARNQSNQEVLVELAYWVGKDKEKRSMPANWSIPAKSEGRLDLAEEVLATRSVHFALTTPDGSQTWASTSDDALSDDFVVVFDASHLPPKRPVQQPSIGDDKLVPLLLVGAALFGIGKMMSADSGNAGNRTSTQSWSASGHYETRIGLCSWCNGRGRSVEFITRGTTECLKCSGSGRVEKKEWVVK